MEAGVVGTDKSDVESVNEIRAMGMCRMLALGELSLSERERRRGQNIFITVYNGRSVNWQPSQSFKHTQMRTPKGFFQL